MTKTSKVSFTLFEVMITIAILAMAGSLFAWKGWELVREHRYTSSLKRFQDEITGAKLLALSYQIDIIVKIESNQKSSSITLQTIAPPKPLKGKFHKKIALPNLRIEGEEKQIALYSNGHIAPHGRLLLFPAQGGGVEKNFLIE